MSSPAFTHSFFRWSQCTDDHKLVMANDRGFEQVLQASMGGVTLLQRDKNSFSPKLWSSLREHFK